MDEMTSKFCSVYGLLMSNLGGLYAGESETELENIDSDSMVPNAFADAFRFVSVLLLLVFIIMLMKSFLCRLLYVGG